MKRQITVDGDQSDWFEQAVFTLKDQDGEIIPRDLFQYAEQLVEMELKKMAGIKTQVEVIKKEVEAKESSNPKTFKKEKLKDGVLYTAVTACFIGVVILLFNTFM